MLFASTLCPQSALYNNEYIVISRFYSDPKMYCHSVIPAKAGIQYALGSRLRGNDIFE
jgi:hypothetical protein